MLLHAAAALLEREPALRSRLVVLVAGGPSGSGLAEPTGAAGAGGAARARRRGALPPAAGRGRAGRRCSGPRTSSRCRATTSRSGWSRWRRRRAGRRWWPRGSAGCRWRWRTAGRGCSSTGTAPEPWADALAAVALDPDRRAALARGRRRARAALLLGPDDRRVARHLRAARRRSSPTGRRRGCARRRGCRERTAAVVAAALAETGVEHEEREPGQFLVTLPGTRRLRTHCWLVVREHALFVQAFVCRRPDEQHEACTGSCCSATPGCTGCTTCSTGSATSTSSAGCRWAR